MEEIVPGPQYQEAMRALAAQQERLEMDIAEQNAHAAALRAEDETTMMDEVYAQIEREIDPKAEAAFREGFKNQRGVDNVRVQAPKAEASFAKQVNKQVKQGDAGGQGRTQNAPPVKVIPAEHDVKEGDTMWALAKRYGISVERIQELNKSVEPTRMRIGSKLRMTDAPLPQAPQAAPSKTMERFNQHMVNFDPRADAITPVGPLETLTGGAGAAKAAYQGGKAAYQGGKAAYQAVKAKAPELSAAMQNILSGRGARPAPQQVDRARAMDEMARRGPPTAAPSRPYPNETPPWAVPASRGRR